LVEAYLKRCDGTSGVWCHVVESKKVAEGVGPKFGWEVGAEKESTDAIRNGLVWALDGTILGRVAGAGDFDVVAGAAEEVEDGGAARKFAALVETYIFVGALWGAKCQPLVQPFHWWGFSTEGLAVKCATKVIGDKDVASLAV
jgi:hypothetical protein